MSSDFVGPGKPFATEEEEFAEYISFLEWWTQATEAEKAEFTQATERYLNG
jgi:hypothetical protein